MVPFPSDYSSTRRRATIPRCPPSLAHGSKSGRCRACNNSQTSIMSLVSRSCRQSRTLDICNSLCSRFNRDATAIYMTDLCTSSNSIVNRGFQRVSIPNSAHQFLAGGLLASPHLRKSSCRPSADSTSPISALQLDQVCHISKSTIPLF